MTVLESFAADGFDGTIVRVEVDIRRGIPGIDIVGLPDSAVRESRERVRVAIRNSGFPFPTDRLLINLAPADIRKEGSRFDLPIASAVLAAAGAIPALGGADSSGRLMLLGELDLSGAVRGVRGVLAAIASGVEAGTTHFIVPAANLAEATALRRGVIRGVSSIREAVLELDHFGRTGCFRDVPGAVEPLPRAAKPLPGAAGAHIARSAGAGFPARADTADYSQMRGSAALKRVITIAAAGGHHLLLYGPPGSGKTMAALRFVTVLPPLDWETSVTVTRIHSIAGLLDEQSGLIETPPFRSPHHSATVEGLIGGGAACRPGEVSLAHGGVLFLDEAAEFRPSLLQALREPIETKRVLISRAGRSGFYPSDFQLILCSNSCPCGNFGRDDEACLCSRREVQLYWKRLGGPLIDRIDIRYPAVPPRADEISSGERLSSASMRADVERARRVRSERGFGDDESASVEVTGILERASRSLGLSARAHLSVLRIARTIADLDERDLVSASDVEEAIELRRYGNGDLYWR
jgi:magnesium chelatase family protein